MALEIKGGRGLRRQRFFPLQKSASGQYLTLVGLGGNIGNVSRRFKALIRQWQDDPRISLLETSPLFLNAAFGYLRQNDFTNAVVSLRTNLSALNLLKVMQHYESKFKRKRSFKNAPRTLDLDILFYSGRLRQSQRLRVPHVGVWQRASVIVPLGLMKG